MKDPVNSHDYLIIYCCPRFENFYFNHGDDGIHITTTQNDGTVIKKGFEVFDNQRIQISFCPFCGSGIKYIRKEEFDGKKNKKID